MLGFFKSGGGGGPSHDEPANPLYDVPKEVKSIFVFKDQCNINNSRVYMYNCIYTYMYSCYI